MRMALTVGERLRIISWADAYRGGEMSVSDILARLNAKRYEQVFEGRAIIDRPVTASVLLGFLNPYLKFSEVCRAK